MSTRLVRRTTAALAAAPLALAVTACGGNDTTAPQTSASATPSSPANGPSQAAGDPTQSALLSAGRLVLSKVPGTTLTSIETDRGGWEVQVVASSGVETQADTDAQGASITSGPTKQDDDAEDRAEHQARVRGAKLDFAAAVETVGQAAPGPITELNLDDYQGKTVWEADVETSGQPKVSVRIDAATGSVISQTTSTPGSDDDD